MATIYRLLTVCCTLCPAGELHDDLLALLESIENDATVITVKEDTCHIVFDDGTETVIL